MTILHRASSGHGFRSAFLTLVVSALLLGFIGMHSMAMVGDGSLTTAPGTGMNIPKHSDSSIYTASDATDQDGGSAPAMPCGGTGQPGTTMASPCVPLPTGTFSDLGAAEHQLQSLWLTAPLPTPEPLPAGLDPKPPSLPQLSIDRR